MKTTERFSDRVENYVKYRPDYPPDVLRLFHEEMNLTEQSVVADVGSGTGISTKIFLENGNFVYAIEPNDAMRNASNNFLKNFPNYRPISGTAENTTLTGNSVDFIVAAQAFHWFDPEKCLPEFYRILRNRGFIVLIWNERETDSTPFLQGYEQLLLEFGTDYKKVRHENITTEKLSAFFQKGYRTAIFENVQVFDFQGLRGRLLSSSYTPNEKHPRFIEMLEKLKRLFAEHQKNDTIEFLYKTKVFYNQL